MSWTIAWSHAATAQLGAIPHWLTQARVAKAVDDFVLLGKGDGRYVSPTTKTYVRLHLADFVVRLDVYPDRLHVDVVGVFAKL